MAGTWVSAVAVLGGALAMADLIFIGKRGRFPLDSISPSCAQVPAPPLLLSVPEILQPSHLFSPYELAWSFPEVFCLCLSSMGQEGKRWRPLGDGWRPDLHEFRLGDLFKLCHRLLSVMNKSEQECDDEIRNAQLVIPTSVQIHLVPLKR
jgi:hypothetical protein